MKGAKFIESIRLENILSFGSNSEPFSLEPLNVFIGPNASGKSNFIEALSLLHAIPFGTWGPSLPNANPHDLHGRIRQGGGIGEWLWKGSEVTPTATIEAAIGYPGVHSEWGRVSDLLKYRMSFTQQGGEFHIVDEAVESAKPLKPGDEPPHPYSGYRSGQPVVAVKSKDGSRVQQALGSGEVKAGQSILTHPQFSTYEYCPELWWTHMLFLCMTQYTEWRSGRDAPIHRPEPSDNPKVLFSNASNLSVVLGDLLGSEEAKEALSERMAALYPSFKDIEVVRKVEDGGDITAEILVYEKGLSQPVPASRLSDGTLRYLWLQTVLYGDRLPYIVCIEEPELGLHPDLLHRMADLLIEKSQHCQLFVTTHSDILVDALTEVPEAVVVFDKKQGATQLKRLDAYELKSWLDEYRLGEVWMRGAIGGTR